MLNKLSKQLDSAEAVTKFLDTVKKEDVKIGVFGGRTFVGTVGEKKYEFKLNELLRCIFKKAEDKKWTPAEVENLKSKFIDVNSRGEAVMKDLKKEKACLRRIQYALTRWKQKVLKTQDFRKSKLEPLSSRDPASPSTKHSEGLAPGQLDKKHSEVKTAKKLVNEINKFSSEYFFYKGKGVNVGDYIPKEYRNNIVVLNKFYEWLQDVKKQYQKDYPDKVTWHESAFPGFVDDIHKYFSIVVGNQNLE